MNLPVGLWTLHRRAFPSASGSSKSVCLLFNQVMHEGDRGLFAVDPSGALPPNRGGDYGCGPYLRSRSRLCPKQENLGVGGPTSTFNKLEAGHLRTLARRSLRRDTQLCRGHHSDSQRSGRNAVQRSGWQDFEKLHDSINT